MVKVIAYHNSRFLPKRSENSVRAAQECFWMACAHDLQPSQAVSQSHQSRPPIELATYLEVSRRQRQPPTTRDEQEDGGKQKGANRTGEGSEMSSFSVWICLGVLGDLGSPHFSGAWHQQLMDAAHWACAHRKTQYAAVASRAHCFLLHAEVGPEGQKTEAIAAIHNAFCITNIASKVTSQVSFHRSLLRQRAFQAQLILTWSSSVRSRLNALIDSKMKTVFHGAPVVFA